MPPFIMDQAEAQRLVDQRPWWYHRFEIFPGVVTPGVYDASHLLRALRFPDDMTGMSVLEIGPADGYFTKMLDMRGANVVAMNICAKDVHGFSVTEKLHGKSLRYVHSNLYDIGKHGFEPFDYVLCSGVLYHLPDMLRGLWLLRSYVRGELLLETLVTRKIEDQPFAEYLPATSCNNDIGNFWAPNVLCVQAMLTDCGFIVTETQTLETRAISRARMDTSGGVKMRKAYSLR